MLIIMRMYVYKIGSTVSKSVKDRTLFNIFSKKENRTQKKTPAVQFRAACARSKTEVKVRRERRALRMFYSNALVLVVGFVSRRRVDRSTARAYLKIHSC